MIFFFFFETELGTWYVDQDSLNFTEIYQLLPPVLGLKVFKLGWPVVILMRESLCCITEVRRLADCTEREGNRYKEET